SSVWPRPWAPSRRCGPPRRSVSRSLIRMWRRWRRARRRHRLRRPGPVPRPRTSKEHAMKKMTVISLARFLITALSFGPATAFGRGGSFGGGGRGGFGGGSFGGGERGGFGGGEPGGVSWGRGARTGAAAC